MMIVNQKGNALVEFAVGAAVLVPMVFFIPAIGKIGDVNQSTEQAGRYAAWERTVSATDNKSDAVLEKEVRNRFLASPDLLIKSNRDGVSGSVNHYWAKGTDQDQHSLMLFSNGENGVEVSSTNQSIPDGPSSTFSEGIAKAGEMMADVIPDSQWGLDGKGLYTAFIKSEIDISGLFASDANCSGNGTGNTVCVQKHNAIFVDDWSSGSTGIAEKRTRTMVPAGVFRPVGNGIAVIGKAVPVFKELKRMRNAFGEVDSNIPVLDRYGDK